MEPGGFRTTYFGTKNLFWRRGGGPSEPKWNQNRSRGSRGWTFEAGMELEQVLRVQGVDLRSRNGTGTGAEGPRDGPSKPKWHRNRC